MLENRFTLFRIFELCFDFILVRYYCQQVGLTSPEDLCLAGYYCNGSATVPGQFPCPIGHYCPTGSDSPVPCLRGYFSKSTLNTDVSNCTACSRGKWCDPNAGVTVQERDCDPGYVCVSGKSFVVLNIPLYFSSCFLKLYKMVDVALVTFIPADLTVFFFELLNTDIFNYVILKAFISYN